ncbi:M23 family metallopeptidase [Lentisalinibacter salinarum]|uniref:M23 family metallopeptidase n=1 Tax=Lentisalinibacter salinarum TaxID=2992239 RepID=UPI0038700233
MVPGNDACLPGVPYGLRGQSVSGTHGEGKRRPALNHLDQRQACSLPSCSCYCWLSGWTRRPSVHIFLGQSRLACHSRSRGRYYVLQGGQRVAQGEPLAKVGNSGNSMEPHLHIEAKRSSDAIGLVVDERVSSTNSLVRNDPVYP